MLKHIPVSDDEYYNALPSNGLQLAEDQARDFLDRARQDSELPTRDTVSGLLTIGALKQQTEVHS